jgi:hypothetical protein
MNNSSSSSLSANTKCEIVCNQLAQALRVADDPLIAHTYEDGARRIALLSRKCPGY